MADAVLLEKRNKIAYITINRPESMNAINHEVRNGMSEAWYEVRDDPDVWTIVLTGAGDRAFCAGGDLREARARATGEFQEPGDGSAPRGAITYPTNMREIGLNKPVIAAVNGYAAGGGFGLALACDIRLSSENAKFGAAEVRWSHMAGGPSTILPRTVPLGWAFWICFTGQFIDAQTAFQIGITQGVYPPQQLMEKATELADTINANGRVVAEATKEFIYNSLDMPLTAARKMAQVYYQRVRQSPDYNEGTAAFVERRKPDFKGEPITTQQRA